MAIEIGEQNEICFEDDLSTTELFDKVMQIIKLLDGLSINEASNTLDCAKGFIKSIHNVDAQSPNYKKVNQAIQQCLADA